MALRAALADGPLPVKRLGEVLTDAFPDVPANALAHLARVAAPLAQLPPRGCWKQPGGVVYQFVDTWLGRPLAEPDPEAIVRRYLAAYGPASAADVTAWSGVPGIPAVLASMDDLVRHTDDAGKKLVDLPSGDIADPETPAPVRLLGLYDNVWLSHAGRDRVTDPAKRKRWMGVNGGLCNTVFVDGWLEGLWRVEDGRPAIVELFRTLSRVERAELEDELDRAGGAAGALTSRIRQRPSRRHHPQDPDESVVSANGGCGTGGRRRQRRLRWRCGAPRPRGVRRERRRPRTPRPPRR